MNDQNMQKQIDDINRKLDIVLEEVIAQKQSRQTVEDLVTDISLIGTDMFKASIVELDNAGIELDGEAVKQLMFKFIRNIGTINEMFEMLESANDLIKDVSPIIHQVGLDGIHKMNELEQKGYFEFIRELSNIADNVVTHFSTEDLRLLADNVVTILETVKSLTQPDMLKALNNGVNVYKNLDTKNIPEYSLWKAFKELNTPEMKKGLGFMITFLKNIANENPSN
ncbi:MAG: DUF1641 domain-containing protein [Bacteroidales bacterium]|nr:DUF1641 domain-containing protein [Bacteroidales bacterium]